MKRLIYQPTIKAFIYLSSEGRTIDISDDIVSATITKRLEAVSVASLTLQNKFGKYTGGPIRRPGRNKGGVYIRPMDNIRIFLSRIGPPIPIFTGYIDDSPLMQLYPGTVTLEASCTLKLLQYTFFDPGLPFMTQWLQKYGFQYNFVDGVLRDQGNNLGNFDFNGGIAQVIYRALLDIGRWNGSAIHIKPLPNKLIQNMAKIAAGDIEEVQEAIDINTKRFNNLFGGDSFISTTNTNTDSNQSFVPGSTGNIKPIDMAKLAQSVGFKGDEIVTMLAIARRESGWNSDAVNFAGAGAPSGATGLWQIAPLNSGGGLDVNPPLGSIHRWLTYTNPTTGQAEFLKGELDVYKNYAGHSHLPAMSIFLDPVKNAKGAYSLFADSGFSPWAIDGHTPPAGLSSDDLSAAQDAFKQLGLLANVEPSSNPLNIGTPDPAQTTTNKITWPFDPPGQITMIQGKGPNPYSNLKFASQVDYVHVIPVLLQIVNDVAKKLGYTVDINSGYRSNSYSDSTGGFAGDPHSKGLAIDANINGSPIGNVIPVATWLQNGVRSGNVANFYKGTTDPVHLDLMTTDGSQPNSLVTGQSAYVGTNFPSDNNSSSSGSTGPMTAKDIAAIAQRSGVFQLQLTSNDATLSSLLTGKRALSNDIPLLSWVNDLTQASGRTYCSGPQGGFYSFFPDYFGWYGQTPYYKITDVETLDLPIQMSDQNLVTHVYGIGPLLGAININSMDQLVSTVASVQDPAFEKFINADDDIFSLADPEAFKNHAFDAQSFLIRYGARPFNQDFVNIRHPVILWMATWREFMKKWAQRFNCDAQFTFLPELFPGGLVNIDGEVQMFIQEVTHNIDLQSGFSTSAELIAATLTPTNTAIINTTTKALEQAKGAIKF